MSKYGKTGYLFGYPPDSTYIRPVILDNLVDFPYSQLILKE